MKIPEKCINAIDKSHMMCYNIISRFVVTKNPYYGGLCYEKIGFNFVGFGNGEW